MSGARVCVPPAQVAEHGDQPFHTNLQCCLHVCVLQSASSRLVAQGLPPFAGCVTTPRKRIFTPLPQRSEHTDHGVHSVSWQSIGGGPVVVVTPPQGCSSLASGHSAPPFTGSTMMLRKRNILPLMHMDQLLHSETWQDTGHFCMSTRTHGLPLFSGSGTS